MFLFAGHHIPQDAFTRHTYGGTVELIQQQDMLRRAAVFCAEAAAFIMAEAVFINQEEADFHAHRHAPLLQQRAFALQVETLFVVQPGLMADPDIEVRDAVLPDRRGAAHGVDAGNRHFASARHVQRQLVTARQFAHQQKLVFFRREEADTAGNVTVKVTRHQRMMIMQ